MRAPSYLGGGVRSTLADFTETPTIAVEIAMIPQQIAPGYQP
jgi:hypothetical protein